MGADQYDQKHYSKARGTSTWPIQKDGSKEHSGRLRQVFCKPPAAAEMEFLALEAPPSAVRVAFLTPGVERQCYFKVG